jgi:hypothetical protein
MEWRNSKKFFNLEPFETVGFFEQSFFKKYNLTNRYQTLKSSFFRRKEN